MLLANFQDKQRALLRRKKHVHKRVRLSYLKRPLVVGAFPNVNFQGGKSLLSESNPMDNIVCNVQQGLLRNMSSHKVGKRSRRDQQLGTNNITTKQKRIKQSKNLFQLAFHALSHRAFLMNFHLFFSNQRKERGASALCNVNILANSGQIFSRSTLVSSRQQTSHFTQFWDCRAYS